MKSNKLSLCAVWAVGIVLILANCVSVSQPTLSPIPMTATMSIVTSSATPTETRSPDISTATAISVPTLPADEAFTLVRSFLENGSNCKLPCWWGIIPGESSMAEVQAQLTTFSGVAEKTYMGKAGDLWRLGTLNLHYPGDNVLIEIYSTFLTPTDEDRVSIIGVDTQALPESLIGQVYGNSDYDGLLSSYTLPQILSTYGVPAEIFVTADIYEYEQNAPDYFEIRLLYPDKGIFLRYKTPANNPEGTYEICPANSFVDLWLLEPDQGTSYQEKLLSLGDEWSGFFPPSEFNKTTVDAFGLSKDEFYQAFRSSTTQCLESPISIWPER